MCLMLLSSTEKKKVKSGMIADKALLKRRAPRPNQVTSKESQNKIVQEKKNIMGTFSETCTHQHVRNRANPSVE